MQWVIADASPLIYLARLGHLDWLRTIYGKVTVPNAVWDEIVVGGKALPEATAVASAKEEGWLQLRNPSSKIPDLARKLDLGEQQAIALANELGATLIIDELAGRLVAQSLGLKIIGTAGILLIGKERGLTPSLKSELNKLKNETTFWLSDELRADLLRKASEEP